MFDQLLGINYLRGSCIDIAKLVFLYIFMKNFTCYLRGSL